MKLSALLQDVEIKNVYTSDPEITYVTDSTDKICEGCAFVCIVGKKTDGHLLAVDALKKGASVIVCEKNPGLNNSVVVEDSRRAYAVMCANFYENSAEKLRIIGITGTNGKTTTAFLLKSILEASGFKVGLIGTVNVEIGSEKYPADLTTPDPADLHRYFNMMSLAECELCIMEVSSQALSQMRTYGITFECGAFTNLSAEHLDYHKTIENYAKAKSTLFKSCKTAVVNADDKYSEMMIKSCKGNIVRFGKNKNYDFYADNDIIDKSGVSYNLHRNGNTYSVYYPMLGSFSVYNSLCALAVSGVLGVDIQSAVNSISNFNGISGRMEGLENNMGINIIIDFAHTPDSLENVLKTLKAVYNGRLITVFGCGGDRDKSKRPLMGEMACKYSDLVFVTSDNPRTENPEAIINDITENLSCSNFYKITDRKLALKSAVSSAKRGDTILVAGKGHEKYQILGTQKIYFNEREIIRKLLEDKARF